MKIRGDCGVRSSDASATEPDWSREKCRRGIWDPGPRLLRAIRRCQKWRVRSGPVAIFVSKLSIWDYRFWGIVCGSSLSLEASLGGGLLIPHAHAIVIGPATLGPNCLVFQQVTIGTGPTPGWPKIGGHVDIGAGAKVLGGIVVGDHAKIGANAVVVQDVPAGATAVGVPARIILAPENEAASNNLKCVNPSSAPTASCSLAESRPISPADLRDSAQRS